MYQVKIVHQVFPGRGESGSKKNFYMKCAEWTESLFIGAECDKNKILCHLSTYVKQNLEHFAAHSLLTSNTHFQKSKNRHFQRITLIISALSLQ